MVVGEGEAPELAQWRFHRRIQKLWPIRAPAMIRRGERREKEEVCFLFDRMDFGRPEMEEGEYDVFLYGDATGVLGTENNCKQFGPCLT